MAERARGSTRARTTELDAATRPKRDGRRDELVQALLGVKERGDEELRALAARAQADLVEAVVRRYRPTAGADARTELPAPHAAGPAWDLLVEAALPHVLPHASDLGVEAVLARVVEAICRYDPDGPAGFLPSVVRQVSEGLPEGPPGGMLSEARPRVAAEPAHDDVPGESGESGESGETLRVRLRALIAGAQLDEQQLQVLRLRLGLDGAPECSLQVAGARLGLTRAQVRALEARTIAQLRRHPSVAMLRARQERRPRGA